MTKLSANCGLGNKNWERVLEFHVIIKLTFLTHIWVWSIKVSCTLLFDYVKSKKVLLIESVCQPEILKKVCLLQIGKTWKQQLESLLIYTKDANLSLRVIPQKFIQYLQYLRSKNWSKANAWRSVKIYNIKNIWSSKFQFLLGLIWSCIMKF